MAASPAVTQSSRPLGERGSLLDFLRRELAPFPGRGVATCRVVVACVLVLVLCMTLRVPEAYLSVWVVFKVALEESGETLLTGVVSLVGITIALALSLVLLFVAMDQQWLRFCLIGVAAAVGLFLRRTFVIGAVGFVLGLVPTLILTLPDFVPVPEVVVRATLWLWSVFALGIAGAVAANLLIAPTDPEPLLREELAERVTAAEGAIARLLGRPADEPPAGRFATTGVARLLALLRSTEIMHPSVRGRHAQQSALITAVDRLATAAAALEILSVEPDAAERERLDAVAAACARVRRSLDDDEATMASSPAGSAVHVREGSALLPVIVEFEHVVALVEQALGPEPITDHAPEAERR